jgi:hypothetical protein
LLWDACKKRKSVRAQQQQQPTTTTGQLSCNQSCRTLSKQVGVAMQCNAMLCKTRWISKRVRCNTNTVIIAASETTTTTHQQITTKMKMLLMTCSLQARQAWTASVYNIQLKIKIKFKPLCWRSFVLILLTSMLTQFRVRRLIIGSSFHVRVRPKSCKKVTSSLPVVQNLRYKLRATMTHLAVNILACQCRIYTKSPAMALPLPKEACPHQKRLLNWADWNTTR